MFIPNILILLIEYETWGLNDRLAMIININTISVVHKIITGHWKGLNSQGQQGLVPFKNDMGLVSYILDPYYTFKNFV